MPVNKKQRATTDHYSEQISDSEDCDALNSAL